MVVQARRRSRRTMNERGQLAAVGKFVRTDPLTLF